MLALILPISGYLDGELDNYALPEVCNRVRGLIDSNTATIKDIANVIYLDPSMVATIMRMANSGSRIGVAPTSTLTDALRLLGLEVIYRLLVTEFALTNFKKLHHDSIDMRRFWRQSFSAAVSCYNIAKKLKFKENVAEEYYITGLLHNIGELIVARKNAHLAHLVEDSIREGVHPHDTQIEQCGFSYPALTALLLEKWSFPSTIIDLTKSISSELDYAGMDSRVKYINAGINCGLCASISETHKLDFLFSDKTFDDSCIKCIEEIIFDADKISYSVIKAMDSNRHFSDL